MVRFLTPFLLLLAPTGEWITKTGEVRTVACTPAQDYGDKARMPKGCIAYSAGVWVSRTYYTDLELQKIKSIEKIKELKQLQQVMKTRISNLELQLSLKTVAPARTKSCTVPVVLSTVGAIGVCSLWNQFK